MSENNIVYRRRNADQEQMIIPERDLRISKRWGMIIVSFFLATILVMCLILLLSSPRHSGKQVRDPVIATIGPTSTIKLSSFLALFRILYSKNWDMLTNEERTVLADTLLQRMIEHEILMELARELHIHTDQSIERSVKQLAESSPGTIRNRSLYDNDNRSANDWQRQMQENLIAMKTKEFIIQQHQYAITDDAVLDYYRENQPEFYREKSSALIKQLVFEDQKLGKTSLKNLQQRKRSLEEELEFLTRTSVSPPELIDLGLVNLHEIEPAEASLIENTPDNQYFGYLQSNDEYVIYHVIEKQLKGQVPFENAKEEIRDTLIRKMQAEVYQEWVRQQYQKLKIKMDMAPVIASLSNEAMLFQPKREDGTIEDD